jgi:Histidine kinase-like ATPase domain
MPTPAAQRLRSARFEFQSREEAAAVAEYVATLVPEPVRVQFVLMELLVNAVEHGNLEIKAAKAELVRLGELDAEVERRRLDPRYRERIAWLEVTREHDHVTLIVGDEGPGFRWQDNSVLGIDNEPCGRGLALARLMSTSGLSFNTQGNIVTARIQW